MASSRPNSAAPSKRSAKDAPSQNEANVKVILRCRCVTARPSCVSARETHSCHGKNSLRDPDSPPHPRDISRVSRRYIALNHHLTPNAQTHERGGAVGERALRRQHPRRAARGVDYANREGRQAGRPHLQLRPGVRRARRAGRHLRRRGEARRRGGARGIQLHHLRVRTDGHGQDAHDGGLPRLGRRILRLIRRFDAQQRGRHPAGHVAHIRAPEGQRRGAQRQVHVPGALQRRNHRSAGRVGPRRGHRRGCQRQSPEASVDGGRKRRRRGEGTGGGHGGQPRGDLRPHQAGKREASHRGDADEQAIQQVALRL